jgi:hypothetical protein
MLQIRPEQLKVLAMDTQRRFEERLVAHALECWPDECRMLGKSRVHEWVRLACVRTAGYEIKSEYGIATYLDVMFILGSSFDTDERTAWARPILNSNWSEREKVDALEEGAIATLEEP